MCVRVRVPVGMRVCMTILCVCVIVCVCVRACVHASVRACVRRGSADISRWCSHFVFQYIVFSNTDSPFVENCNDLRGYIHALSKAAVHSLQTRTVVIRS